MGRVCCFSFALSFNIIAMISLTVAIATDYWFEVSNNKQDLKDVVSNNSKDFEENYFKYPYHVGLWLTCYEEAIPDTGDFQIQFKFEIKFFTL